MDDLISRQASIDFIDAGRLVNPNEPRWSDNEVVAFLKSRPSAQIDTWMERNRERILQAGMEGREVEFRIGGRLFAIREKAQ